MSQAISRSSCTDPAALQLSRDRRERGRYHHFQCSPGSLLAHRCRARRQGRQGPSAQRSAPGPRRRQRQRPCTLARSLRRRPRLAVNGCETTRRCATAATLATRLHAHEDDWWTDDSHTETLCALAIWRAEIDDNGQDPREEFAFQNPTHRLLHSGLLRQQGGGVTKAWTPGAPPAEWAGCSCLLLPHVTCSAGAHGYVGCFLTLLTIGRKTSLVDANARVPRYAKLPTSCS